MRIGLAMAQPPRCLMGLIMLAVQFGPDEFGRQILGEIIWSTSYGKENSIVQFLGFECRNSRR